MPSSSHRSDASAQDDLELEALALQLALRLSLEDLAPESEAREEPSEEPEPLPSDLWAYAVWGGPDTVDIVGVHVGGRAAWDGILQVIGAYRRGHRLRRAPTEVEAIALYEREAPRHGAPLPPRVYRY